MEKYSKTCPFCGKTISGIVPCNLVCDCNAKYYFFDGKWLERKLK